jgi:hypothetical protein
VISILFYGVKNMGLRNVKCSSDILPHYRGAPQVGRGVPCCSPSSNRNLKKMYFVDMISKIWTIYPSAEIA